MHRHKLLVGVLMSLGHFIVLLAVLGFWIAGGFLFEEMVTALGLIGPLFAGYTTVIFAYVIDHPEVITSPGEKISLTYRIMSLFVPLLFIGIVGGAVVLWAYKIAFTTFDQFKTLVGLLEGAFGVYVGQFIYSMFKKPQATVGAAG